MAPSIANSIITTKAIMTRKRNVEYSAPFRGLLTMRNNEYGIMSAANTKNRSATDDPRVRAYPIRQANSARVSTMKSATFIPQVYTINQLTSSSITKER